MELGLRLLLNANRKSYMTFKMLTFNLTLWPWKVKLKVTDISTSYISHYWMELDLRFLFNTNRKWYMIFKWWRSIWPCVILKAQAQGQGYFKGQYFAFGKTNALGNLDYYWTPIGSKICDLERSNYFYGNLQGPWSYVFLFFWKSEWNNIFNCRM